MIFIDNKYAKWYMSIIKNAENRLITGYTEKHHIIPKSCGGSNKSSNLVVLTAKEHFICHLLLTKAVSDEFKFKMIYAFHGLKAKQPKQLRYKSALEVTNSSMYKRIKEELILIKKQHVPWNKGKKLPSSWNKGISPSNETIQKIKDARKKQDMSYRKGKPMSDEQKQKISKTLKGNIPWNKDKPGTGFGKNPDKNPMKNPESIIKMLESRKKNKENKKTN